MIFTTKTNNVNRLSSTQCNSHLTRPFCSFFLVFPFQAADIAPAADTTTAAAAAEPGRAGGRRDGCGGGEWGGWGRYGELALDVVLVAPLISHTIVPFPPFTFKQYMIMRRP